MKMPRLSRRQRLLLHCAPFNEKRIHDRAMRSAVFRVRKADEFAHQQAFDRAVAGLVQAVPIPEEVAEWFSKETTVAPPRRTWKTTARNPAILAIGIAVAVMAAVFVFHFVEHIHDF